MLVLKKAKLHAFYGRVTWPKELPSCVNNKRNECLGSLPLRESQTTHINDHGNHCVKNHSNAGSGPRGIRLFYSVIVSPSEINEVLQSMTEESFTK